MKKVFYIITYFLLASHLAIAETVYKGQDANGKTIYSDTPLENGTKIVIQPLPTYTPTPIPSPQAVPIPAKQITYQVHILEPQSEETITTGITTVIVKLSINPVLQPTDKIQLVLNGKPYGPLYSSLSIPLDQLPRGAYQLYAEIISESSPEHNKGQSETITFYQQRVHTGVRPLNLH